MPHILLVDDEEALRSGLREVLEEEGYKVSEAPDGNEALRQINDQVIDLVCTDVRMPGMDGLELLRRIKVDQPEVEVIVITGFANVSSAVSAVKQGAHDYLSKPFDLDEVRLTVERALERRSLVQQQRRLTRKVKTHESESRLIGESPAFQRVIQLVDKIAPTPSTVLVLGETGTGKELIAREIHERSPRKGELFIPINCGALPDTLLESELFGHSKGAFTGADKANEGLFEAADGGTLFLDEIGNISVGMQSRLLRVLETGELLRLGERRVRHVDVRIVAATNADLKLAVEDGTFRQDFYYRLNVMSVDLPPLRDRAEDIPLLADHFLQTCAARFGKTIRGYSPAARELLRNHNWPGNIRELQHAVERAAILCVTPEVQPEDLPSDLVGGEPGTESAGGLISLAELEKAHILATLRNLHGHRGQTAEVLGINRRTLYRKLIEYGVEEGPKGGGEDPDGDEPSQLV